MPRTRASRRWGLATFLSVTMVTCALQAALPTLDQVKDPSLLLPLPSGCLIGARNGLFLLRTGSSGVERISGEESVNDIQFAKDRLLVATDNGLFEYSPEGVTKSWALVPPYRRSVKQVYAYGENEFFWGTQDGMFYQHNRQARQIGPNEEVISIAGKLDSDVVSIAEMQVLLTNGEGGAAYAFEDKVTAAVTLGDRLYVSTLSGVMMLDVAENQIKPVRPGLVARDMVVIGGALLLATPQGLLMAHPQEPNKEDTKVLEGDFNDIQAFHGGWAAIATNGVHTLSAEGVPLQVIAAPKAQIFHHARQFGSTLFLCLNSGFLRGEIQANGVTDWTFHGVASQVKDVYVKKDGQLLLATPEGLVEFTESAGRTVWIVLAVGVLCVAGAGYLFATRRRTVIFISYRRDDARDAVGRVRAQLVRVFGKKQVRVDVHDITTGLDFREEIKRNLKESAVVLIVIGPDWLKITDGNGNRRLWAKDDLVRYEVEQAKELGKATIPVLLGNTPPLQEKDLPESIAYLAYLELQRLRHDPDFDSDLEELVAAIRLHAALAQKRPAHAERSLPGKP